MTLFIDVLRNLGVMGEGKEGVVEKLQDTSSLSTLSDLTFRFRKLGFLGRKLKLLYFVIETLAWLLLEHPVPSGGCQLKTWCAMGKGQAVFMGDTKLNITNIQDSFNINTINMGNHFHFKEYF